jgi:uncharacterized protein YecT (DUF1311 family)
MINPQPAPRKLHLGLSLVALALLTLPGPADAAQDRPYGQFHPSQATVSARMSSGFGACMGQTKGVTANMQDCLASEYTRLDRALNATYASVMRRRGDKGAADLRQHQRVWLKVRWDGCREDMEKAGGGSAGILVFSDCQLREVVRRILWLEQEPNRI